MASIAVYYCLFLLFCFGVLEGYSACDHINYTTINNIRRSTAYNATAGLCDRGFIKDGSWYRFQSDAGDKMPEFNPGIKSCGTFVPIWLKGNHPSTVGVEVDRMACAPLPHAYPFDCGLKYDIKVINCGRFFLYQLKEPSTCNIAYCAGTKLGKGCSIDGSSIPVCSGVVPSIMRPKVRPKDEDRVYVALQCFWDYFDDASHVEFHVKWFKDSNETTYAMQHTFNGTANQTCHENLYEKQIFVNRVTGKIERDERGYEWNKRVYCKVRGRFHGGGWSQWKSSGTIFTGIEVHPRTIYLDECETNREIFVSLRPVLPIRKTSYKFEIGYEEEHQNTLAKICIRGRISSDRCLSELTERHNFYHPLWIRITAVCPSIETGESLKEVKVRFHNQKADLTNNLFWYNYDFLPIKVTNDVNEFTFCSKIDSTPFFTKIVLIYYTLSA
ncbi:uncharacterized protein LOC114535180 isoform X2 [Dendronephthya gigantea]|uniref:uncharacterized protein LOC114535180 isoform X2 n=1 Tax=Dendronephthya gigantea TaxID=151771 RepID=UPI00106A6A9A|nr:uncharacterized protein LOC114535180 isoform X2 [Dendronephthya gigantea]